MAPTAKHNKPQKTRSTAQNKPKKYDSPLRQAIGLLIIGLSVLAMYLLIAGGETNGLRKAMLGVSGVLSYIVPLMIAWIGVLVIFSGKSTAKMSVGRILLIVFLFILLFAGVHVFVAPRIFDGMLIFNYTNFVVSSFSHAVQGGGGSGAIGAIFSYHLFRLLGSGGSCIVLLMLFLIDLVLMGKLSLYEIGEKTYTKMKTGMQAYKVRRDEREEARVEKAVLREEQRVAKREQKAARSYQEWEPWNDPSRKDIYIENVANSDAPTNTKNVMNRTPERADIPKFLQKNAKKVRVLEPALQETPTYSELDDDQHTVAPLKSAKVSADEDLLEPDEVAQVMDEAAWDEVIVESSEDDLVINDQADPSENSESASYLDKLPFVDEDDDYDFSSDNDIEAPQASQAEAPKAKVLPVLQPKTDEELELDDDDTEVSRRIDRTPVVKPREPLHRQALEFETEEYNYPPVDLLQLSQPNKVKNMEQQDQMKAQKLEETLKSFGISAKLTGIAHGPAVTRFEMQPAPGVKVSRIVNLADDIALNLAATSIRIEAPIPGKPAIGVEIPNEVIEMVPIREVLESSVARRNPSRLAVALGKDNSGRHIIADIAKMPHVLIAGATGSGKSVCINSIICSILYRATPEEVRMIMIDPKVVELSVYNSIPHLLIPVVTDPKKASGALNWAVMEMTDRYKKFADRGVRNMQGYNAALKEGEKSLPQIVVIIDELADLMMVAPGEVEDAICRLAQLARAAGIHLVIATQRPSVNVITGVIKANIPSRIAFTVASQVDSRTILDVGGAEKLLGRGDMLYAPSGTNKPQRVQGAWVSEEEVHAIVEYIKARHDTDYNEEVIEQLEQLDNGEADSEKPDDEYDELLPQAVEMVVEAGSASISMLQRRLRVGYARAGRMIDEMAARGIVSQSEGAKPRDVLITREQYKSMFNIE